MKIIIFLIITFFVFTFVNAQTVIEMGHPGDANIILLEVAEQEKADFVIYKSDDKTEYTEWDCMWRFKKWGFSNFSIYLTKNANDSLLSDNEMGIQYAFHGKVFFTNDKEKRGYKTPGFKLEGVFRKTGNSNSDQAKQSKQQATQRSLQEDGEQ